MSAATTARSTPASAANLVGAADRARALRLVVARRSTAARAPFVVAVVLSLGAGLLGLLVLNTALAQDAFALHSLQVNGHVLADREQALQREVADLQSPAALAARATALGMVPGGSPAFLRLPDGAVLGAPTPGKLPALPPVPAPARPAPVTPGTPGTPGQVARHPAATAPATGGWTKVPARSAVRR